MSFWCICLLTHKDVKVCWVFFLEKFCYCGDTAENIIVAVNLGVEIDGELQKTECKYTNEYPELAVMNGCMQISVARACVARVVKGEVESEKQNETKI